jgi:hypothetical protein
MTAANPTLPVAYGSWTNTGSTTPMPITGNVNSPTLMQTENVTLSTAGSYARSVPPGYPDPNPGVPIANSYTAYPQTIPGGARVQFFSDESAALLLAGVASS